MREEKSSLQDFLNELQRDTMLQGQWSKRYLDNLCILYFASPFYETWVRLRYSAALARLERAGLLKMKTRFQKRQVSDFVQRGEWNRFAWTVLEQARDATTGTFLITGKNGAGKTFLTKAVFGPRQEIFKVRTLSRRLAMAKKEGRHQELLEHLIRLPVLILDDVHHLLETPALSRHLVQVLAARNTKPLLALSRTGPGFDTLAKQISSRLSEALRAEMGLPDQEATRHLLRAYAIKEKVRMDPETIKVMLSRPMTPGRMKHVVSCFKQLPDGSEHLASMVRELLRYSHADDLKDLFSHICHHHGISSTALSGKRRPLELQKARQEYAHLALQAGWRPKEVAMIMQRSERCVKSLAKEYRA